MRRYAISVAVAGFFVLAAVGSCFDVPAMVCGLRALGGAAVLYVMTMIVGKIVLGILVQTVMESHRVKESESESRS